MNACTKLCQPASFQSTNFNIGIDCGEPGLLEKILRELDAENFLHAVSGERGYLYGLLDYDPNR
jgi:hypothetical protein